MAAVTFSQQPLGQSNGTGGYLLPLLQQVTQEPHP